MIERKERVMPEFNTTALPDIIFMLLFFFMVVTVMKKDDNNLAVKIPTVNFAEQMRKHDNFIVISTLPKKNGKTIYSIDKKVYSDKSLFRKALFLKSKNKSNDSILKAKIKIDKNTPMKIVNEIKRVLQDSEIYNVEYMIAKIKV